MQRTAVSRGLWAIFACAVGLACAEVGRPPGADGDTETPAEEGGGGREGDGSGTTAPGDDAGPPGRPPPPPPGDAGPAAACRALVLDCLDAADAKVIEVPTEMGWQAALDAAKANDTIQVRGLRIPSTYRVPPYVTLRGCAGAKLAGWIAFTSGAGTVEGFTVEAAGSILATKTGSYVVRHNRFVGTAAEREPGVAGRSTEAYVAAQVTLLVEANTFEGRAVGIEASTRYDTMVHQVSLTARNNAFRGVASPIVVSEYGLVGIIDATLEHNTFHGFQTAILLSDGSRLAKTSGNLFADGTVAVKATRGSTFDVAYSFLAPGVTSDAPASGAFAIASPRFVDADAGDLRLAAGSPGVDAVAAGTPVPSEDIQGCPRPAGANPPRADVGAYENQ